MNGIGVGSNLKRCSSCRGENVKIVSFGYGKISAICEDCELSTGYMLDDAEAEEAWNSRPIEDELLERAKRAEDNAARLQFRIEQLNALVAGLRFILEENTTVIEE